VPTIRSSPWKGPPHCLADLPAVTAVPTLEWFGCATFRLRVDGLVVMLDAYIDRAPDAAGPGIGVEVVEECDWILIGHSHFDHLYGAERMMAATDAMLVGSYETIRVMTEAGVDPDRMICVAGGETIALSPTTRLSVYPSQHSCVWSHGQMTQPDEVCLGDLGVTWHEQQRKMHELTDYLTGSLAPASVEHLLSSMGGHSPRGDGGALLFQLDTPGGSLVFQDTSGHWSGILDALDPDVAILAAAGRANIDGEPIQGSLLEFLERQVALLAPTTTVLCHHDDWLPGFSVATDMAPIRELFDRLPTELLELVYTDPTPLTALAG
jgi:glyoxylase-like metal-dependent hydrolase (beta-lactamase superfamily II)